MGTGTPLRTAGGTGSVDDGPAGVDGTLVEVARAAVAGAGDRGGEGGWLTAVDGRWCTVRPPGREIPGQGRKLHISAATDAAVQVLAAVSAVLAEDPCAFTFAADREKLRAVNSRRGDRGPAGTFITVHPADDAQFRRLAEELHRATLGLPGPVLLSDRPYAPGSRVHHRYGALAARTRPGTDEPGDAGASRPTLGGPGGATPEDVRTADFRCPPWAVDPVEGRGSTRPAGVRRTGGVLLGGRYALTAAVRHDAKGGVFLGRDTVTDTDVVVKQARTSVGGDRSGTDARAALRHEARLLRRLDGQELTPRPLELVEQDDSLFLVRERVPGRQLDSWVAARLRRDGAPDVPWADAGPMALALVDLLERVHTHRLVLRDLSPGNVMVRPDGGLRLVDLELAAEAGAAAGSAGAPGYRAPEHHLLRRIVRSEHTADLYALGGLFFLLATGHDPLLPEDLPQARPVGERLGRWLALAARGGETARRLAPVVLALRADAPEHRMPLGLVRAALAAGPGPAPGGRTAVPGAGLDRLIDDGLRHLARTATPRRRDRLWPGVPAGRLTDPCDLRHGAAGVLGLLARAGSAPLPEGARETARAAARTAAAWIERRSGAEPVVLPGLPFGRSGATWALLDAAEALGDRALARRAAELARRVPVAGPDPDVCHGAAGAGLLQLRLYRSTSESGFLERAAACARALLSAARPEPYGTVWPGPEADGSGPAGAVRLGYAHGVAGVGAFLLAAAGATGDATLLDGARQAADTLAATVRAEGEGAWWPRSEGEPEHVRPAHRCSGSSGAGSFLVRYWQATGDPAAHRLALAAGQTVLDARRHGGVSACHGLAGDGEYLLDLARATGDTRFRAGAEELATLIAARAALRDGLLVLPDETGTGCAAAHDAGSPGALAFLLRLRYGGPRSWVDPEPVTVGPV
ncbi:class IV lanthionine synthetase LanL [Kitasatospora sp. NBC_00374]|uniref:class IV lanthionine synthetase LanL n=1 Tax=Kitasatospora sp. NBC_00374 TaxID=2975964 RepID=UPI0030E4ED44